LGLLQPECPTYTVKTLKAKVLYEHDEMITETAQQRNSDPEVVYSTFMTLLRRANEVGVFNIGQLEQSLTTQLHKSVAAYLGIKHLSASPHAGQCSVLNVLSSYISTVYMTGTMLHGSETWAPNASDLQRLRRNDRAMIR